MSMVSKIQSLRLQLHINIIISSVIAPGNNGELTAVWDRLQTETSCCGLTGPAEYSNTSGRWDMMPASCCLEPPGPNSTRCARPFASGCEERLLAYLRGTASLLAILGYCVLAFLKLCFLGILRYWARASENCRPFNYL